MLCGVQHLKLNESIIPPFCRDPIDRAPLLTPPDVLNLESIGPAGNVDCMTYCTR